MRFGGLRFRGCVGNGSPRSRASRLRSGLPGHGPFRRRSLDQSIGRFDGPEAVGRSGNLRHGRRFRRLRIEQQELPPAIDRRNPDCRDADPQRPVETTLHTNPHGFAPLRIQPEVERLVGDKILEFQLSDALDGQQVGPVHPGDPAVVNGLRLGFGFFVSAGLTHDAGNLVDQRHAPLLRGEGHRAARRQYGSPVEPPGSLPLGVERAYAGQKNLPAAGQQVADKPADLLFHRVRVHFFFFLGVAAGAFGTGPGPEPFRAAPRQII